ncbi:MAG: hypothetical protein HN382_04400 [Gammaproteobacteria bacterium]|jgi:DNA repair exonuclease SbcCD ATPase subunit|nr:hypothetical protein [Gammaproteobacteria bacterium]MBT4607924.1 hypothetical protein [Thiotrichales bacterium]MBT3473581.1 hypothetical protein [Gammaproteobacteria bacterium]MBT3966515.1 hypothetical protein [Gammaproteobacteria bacterium]MBT4079105.1 hypothetical protein [Gammaproteobacteria bacterium]
MSQPQPKGLLTSLILFITVGLFSLATLFTVLILEVRSGQEQLNQQIAQLSGTPIAKPANSERLPSADPQQLAQMQATIELIATRQRTLPAPPKSQKLEQLSSKLDGLLQLYQNQQAQNQQTRDQAPPPEVTAILPESVIQQLEQLTIAVATQAEQSTQQSSQLQHLTKQSQTQQQTAQANQQYLEQQFEQLIARPVSAPLVATTYTAPLHDLGQQLEQLTLQQQQAFSTQKQIKKLTQQIVNRPTETTTDHSVVLEAIHIIEQKLTPPSTAAYTAPLHDLGQQLEQLTVQQQQALSTQKQIKKLTKQIANRPTHIPTDNSAVLDAIQLIEQKLIQISNNQKQIQTAQRRVEQLTQQFSEQQTQSIAAAIPPFTPAPASLNPAQLEALNAQLQQLTKQQQQIERNLMKPVEQSNTIKPYSYRAR